MVSVIQVRSTLELRDVLRELQGKYLVQDWHKMELSNLLKELPKSGRAQSCPFCRKPLNIRTNTSLRVVPHLVWPIGAGILSDVTGFMPTGKVKILASVLHTIPEAYVDMDGTVISNKTELFISSKIRHEAMDVSRPWMSEMKLPNGSPNFLDLATAKESVRCNVNSAIAFLIIYFLDILLCERFLALLLELQLHFGHALFKARALTCFDILQFLFKQACWFNKQWYSLLLQSLCIKRPISPSTTTLSTMGDDRFKVERNCGPGQLSTVKDLDSGKKIVRYESKANPTAKESSTSGNKTLSRQ
ncbi:hypothetical protein Tco_1493388 [Tanacetum coccineum]